MAIYQRNSKHHSSLEEILGIHLPFGGKSRQERVEVLSRSISEILQSTRSQQIADRLELLLKSSKSQLWPEDRLLIHSFLYIHGLKVPIRIAVVMHLFKGHINAFDVHGRSPDILGARIHQLQELSSVNSLFSWEIFLVADGGYGLKSRAEEYVANQHPEEIKRIHISEMDSLMIAKLRSFKGAPLIQGLRQALEGGADAVTFPDFNEAPHLAQLGNLLEIIQREGGPVAIGSRRLRSSVIYKVWFRQLSSLIFNKWVWLQAPELIGITDTQTPLKLYPRGILEEILPISTEGRFDTWFDYGLSFEVELLRRTVRTGYPVIEIPSLDVLEMSARPQGHLILQQSRQMASAVSTQRHRYGGFQQFFQIFATGGESYILGHPSLNILIKIPRHYHPNLLYSLRQAIHKLRQHKQGQTSNTVNYSGQLLDVQKKMGLWTTKTTLGAVLQALFMWRPLRPLVHTLLDLAQGERGENFPQAYPVHERLGELVVPFEIQENCEISVLMPLSTRVKNLLAFLFRSAITYSWRLTAPVRRLMRAAWHPIDPLVRWILSRLIQPWAGPLLVWFWSRAENLLIRFWQSLPALIRLVWIPLSSLIRSILKWLARWIRWLSFYAKRFFGHLPSYLMKIWNWFAVLIQRFLDWTGMGELIRLLLVLLQPLSERLFRLINWLGRGLHSMLRLFFPPYDHIVVRQALVMERVVTVEDLLPILRLQNGEVRKLIDRHIHLQKELWERGAFNIDVNILEDSGLDSENRLVLVDFTEVVFSREESNRYMRANSEVVPRFHFRIFEALTSAEDLEYYQQSIRTLYRELLSPIGQAKWSTRPARQVPPPAQMLHPHAYSCNTIVKSIENRWRFLMDQLVQQSSTRTTAYLPVAPREISAAILERVLNEAPPALRTLAEGIVNQLGGYIGKEFWNEGADQAYYSLAELSAKLPRRTRKVAEQILAFSAVSTHLKSWEKSKSAWLLQRAIEAGSGGRVHLKLPHRNERMPLETTIPQRHIGKNSFDNSHLRESLLKTPDVLVRKSASEPFVIYSFIRGKGSRLGLLSLQNTKPEVHIFGRSLLDYSSDIITRFFPANPQAEQLNPGWIVLTVGDNFFLPWEQDDFVRSLTAHISASTSSLLYFDMPLEAQNQDSFLFWLTTGCLAIFQRASRFGPTLTHLLRQAATELNSRVHFRKLGGAGLPGVILLRPTSAEILFEQLRHLSPRKRNSLEFYRDLILPLKLSLSQWELLWESDSGISQTTWMGHWQGMQKLKQQTKPFGIVYNGSHLNVNTSRDVYNLYQSVVNPSSPMRRQQIRWATGLPLTADLIDSQVMGQVAFQGNYLLFKSRLYCSPGIRLGVEDSVVIDDADLQFVGPPGDYVIPRGTVIAHSNYRGRAVGRGAGGFWYRVNVHNGQSIPFLADSVTTTLALPSGQSCTAGLSIDFDIEHSETQPLEAFGGLSLVELRSYYEHQRVRSL